MGYTDVVGVCKDIELRKEVRIDPPLDKEMDDLRVASTAVGMARTEVVVGSTVGVSGRHIKKPSETGFNSNSSSNCAW